MAWLFELLRLVFEPRASSAIAALLVGQPSLATELTHICRRESHCRVVAAHPADAWAGASMRRNAIRVGWLDPRCPFHHGDPERFSTRGTHGLSAAYSLRFLGDCLPPEVLDVPMVSAIAAARRAQAQCRHHGACTVEARHRLWAGANRTPRPRELSRRRAPARPRRRVAAPTPAAGASTAG
ncbi:MAG: hypothetical protein IPH07_38230 [Deltaproteobacteria bacterium]|nr:hypothetical protein [Deltaproteobacteria bacterium]MBK8236045.1 hypothetical protein [Deltaproteobacteria bacterium]MBK8713667.1 hypothetical protein [Deltaproteobacteria bacterium]MBP7288860.1 hypothetical protein [Nannocystaceae bacterium]